MRFVAGRLVPCSGGAGGKKSVLTRVGKKGLNASFVGEKADRNKKTREVCEDLHQIRRKDVNLVGSSCGEKQ